MKEELVLEKRKNWLDWCEQAVFFLLLVLMADCTFFGAGRTLIVAGLGFRMLVLGLLMACSVPVILRDLKKLMTNKVLWILVVFALWLVVQAARGIVNGNSFGILLSDLKGFAYFVAVLPAICVLNSKKRLHTLMKTMMYASVALAVVSLVSTCMYKWCHDVFNALYEMDSESNILVLSCIIERKVPRLFFKSTNYFLVGCAFSLYFYVTGEKKGDWKYPLFTGLCLFALLVSYTRACYLAAAVAAFALVVIYLVFGSKSVRTKTWKWVGLAVAAFVVITGGLSLIMGINYVQYALERVGVSISLSFEESVPEEKVMLMAAPNQTEKYQVVSLSDGAKPFDDWDNVDWDTLDWDNVDWGSIDWENIDIYKINWDKIDMEAIDWDSFNRIDWEKWEQQDYNNIADMNSLSDAVRAETLAEMNGYISESPILGHGLGKAITCRENGLAEYFYHDVIVKTGAIGLVLYLLPILWMALALLGKKIAREPKLLLGSWMAVLLGFLAFSYYNPYMNASLGILFYCCIIGIFSNLRKQKS